MSSYRLERIPSPFPFRPVFNIHDVASAPYVSVRGGKEGDVLSSFGTFELKTKHTLEALTARVNFLTANTYPLCG